PLVLVHCLHERNLVVAVIAFARRRIDLAATLALAPVLAAATVDRDGDVALATVGAAAALAAPVAALAPLATVRDDDFREGCLCAAHRSHLVCGSSAAQGEKNPVRPAEVVRCAPR